MKLLIDTESGTIVSAINCYIVDTDELTDEQNSSLEVTSDEETSEIARKHGIPLMFMGEYCGWGDLNYGNSVSYSPVAIRDEIDVLKESMPSKDEYLKWASTLNKETLEIISAFAISDDKAWLKYQDVVIDAIQAVYERFHQDS